MEGKGLVLEQHKAGARRLSMGRQHGRALHGLGQPRERGWRPRPARHSLVRHPPRALTTDKNRHSYSQTDDRSTVMGGECSKVRLTFFTWRFGAQRSAPSPTLDAQLEQQEPFTII